MDRRAWPGFGLPLSGPFRGPFSFVWCSAVASGVYSASRAESPFDLFGLPFIVAGCYLLFGRFVLDLWLRRKTTSAITDKRILIQHHDPFGISVSIDLLRLPEMTIVDESGSHGTLRFGTASSSTRGGRGRIDGPALDGVPQFIAIERANDVLSFIIEAADEARADRMR